MFISLYSIDCIKLLCIPDEKKEKKHPFVLIDHTNVQENAEEVVDKEATVTFVDKGVSASDSRPFEGDALRSDGFTSEASISQFLSRPLQIKNFQWTTASIGQVSAFNPWADFLNHPAVRAKIANYKLFRGNLHIKITVNGSPFHYGRLLAFYQPLSGYDDMWDPYNPVGAFTLYTQKPHIFINPTTSEGGDLNLPFFWPQNSLDIVSSAKNKMGTVRVHVLNKLKHANDGSDPVFISVFAWASNVELGAPTASNAPVALSVAENADEYSGTGVVSKPASVIANFAMKAKNIPAIAPYARATEIGAGALSKMASIFGYSRPAILQPSVYRPNTKSSFCLSNVEDDVMKLSLDSKQELTIDSRAMGYSGEDEMDLLRIAQKESWMDTFTWAQGANSQSIIFQAEVQPMLYDRPQFSSGPYFFPAISFASLPFKRWRGSIRFRFQVVASMYHRGRLKISWDPSTNPTSDPDTNTQYSTIVDISETSDFTIEVGWGNQKSWLTRQLLVTEDFQKGQCSAHGPLTLRTTSAANPPYCNGYISVSIVNDLAVPNTVVNNDIEVNVYCSAGDDFELAEPDGYDISKLTLFRASDVDMPVRTTTDPQQPLNVVENAEEVPTPGDYNKPDSTPQTIQMSDSVVGNGEEHLIHFGEVFKSFRPLIKRYNAHERIAIEADAVASSTNVIYRPAFPAFGGYQSKCDADAVGDITVQADRANKPLVQVLSKPYYPACTPLLTYVTSAFTGWRGSVRWFIDFSPIINPGYFIDEGIMVERKATTTPANLVLPAGTDVTTTAQLIAQKAVDEGFSGTGGMLLQAIDVNPTINFDVPYYSTTRFSPARWLQRFGGKNTTDDNGVWTNDPCDFMPFWGLKMAMKKTTLTGKRVLAMCAAGDDFNVAFYQGPPIFYQDVDVE